MAEFNEQILKFAPDGNKSTFAGGIGHPLGLAFDGAGNLFAVDGIANAVFKYTPDGTKTAFAAGFVGPAGLACDRLGNVFVADTVGDKIVKVTPTGVQTTFASSGLDQPFALTFDSSGAILFVADFGSDTILRYSPDGTRTVFAPGLNGPEGLAFDSGGNLFETDNGSGTIFIFTPSQFPFVTGVSGMGSLAFEPTRHQFLNVSTRALVGTGDSAMIGGFIMNGNGQVDEAVVARVIGPSLTAFGVAGAIQDPTLELRNSDGALIATNDNWKTRSTNRAANMVRPAWRRATTVNRLSTRGCRRAATRRSFAAPVARQASLSSKFTTCSERPAAPVPPSRDPVGQPRRLPVGLENVKKEA